MGVARNGRGLAVAVVTIGLVQSIAFPSRAHAGFFDFLFGQPSRVGPSGLMKAILAVCPAIGAPIRVFAGTRIVVSIDMGINSRRAGKWLSPITIR